MYCVLCVSVYFLGVCECVCMCICSRVCAFRGTCRCWDHILGVVPLSAVWVPKTNFVIRLGGPRILIFITDTCIVILWILYFIGHKKS